MVRDYKQCPRLFYYRHILKLKLPQKQLNLLFGGAIHKGIEIFHNTKSLDAGLAAFRKEFDKNKLAEDEQHEYQPHLAEGERILRRYVDAQDYLRIVHGISPEGVSEGYFKVNWTDPITGEKLELPITGIIDRRVKSGQLIDFKTSSKSYKQKKADELDQATIYSYSGEILFGDPVKEFAYIVFVKKRKNPIQVVKTKRSKQDYSLMFKEMKSIIKSIKAKKFHRGCRGFQAKWCDCRRYEEYLKI